MSNATNAVVENRLSPVTKAEPVAQPVVTGQYLYDNFVQANESDRTRMTQIRELVQSADPFQMQGATDKLVEIARKADLDGGLPEKETKVVNGKEVERRTRGPKEASAMNVRTIIRTVWGALKFAPTHAERAGMTADTGYFAAKKIADTALKDARLLWNGEHAPTDADRETARLKREQRVETGVLAKALVDTPRLPGETKEDHLARVSREAEKALDKARADAEQKVIEAIVDKIFEKHGNGIAFRISEEIMARLDLTHADPEPAPEQLEESREEQHA